MRSRCGPIARLTGHRRCYYPVLRDVSARDTSVEVLGERMSFPVMVAPTAFQRMACDEGECATARAAARAGTIMVMSTLATTAIEEVVAAAEGPKWFQLYIYKDRGATADLVRRAEAAGCRALVLTVDAAVWGRREADVRNNFTLPDGLTVANLAGAREGNFPAGIGPVRVGGLCGADARCFVVVARSRVAAGANQAAGSAQRHGAGRRCRAAVEHGWRGRLSPTTAGGNSTLHLRRSRRCRGWWRRSREKCRCLSMAACGAGRMWSRRMALGAQAVLIGRPVLWGLAADGEEGAYRVLEMLRAELDLAMALCGARTVREIDRSLVKLR